MAGHRSCITTESCSCANGANVSSVWPIFITISLNSEAPHLEKKIFYSFQFALTPTYKCPWRRVYICITWECRGEGTAWSLPAGGAPTTKLEAARSHRVKETETPFHSLHHVPSILHAGHGAIAAHRVYGHVPAAVAIATSAEAIKT